jgi:hypothetical protein
MNVLFPPQTSVLHKVVITDLIYKIWCDIHTKHHENKLIYSEDVTEKTQTTRQAKTYASKGGHDYTISLPSL